MKRLVKWLGPGLFAALSLFFLWFGFVYYTVREPLWFHAAAIPPAAAEAVRPIYFALMSLIGGSSFALGVLGLFTTATAIRKGSTIAAVAIAISFAIPLVAAAITAERLAHDTGAPTSWHLMGILLSIDVVALGASLLARKGRLQSN